jgi:hypothetical protein
MPFCLDEGIAKSSRFQQHLQGTFPPLTVSGRVDSVRISKSVVVGRVCARTGPDDRSSAQATATAAATQHRTFIGEDSPDIFRLT